MGTETIVEDEDHKKGRRRKKLLYSSILQQMEFYFSDSNLSKDRFLSVITKEDPYVDISTFLKFNKIRKLTTNISDITKAISKSELLELSEDKSKVKRKLPIKVKENVEECTLYVERLKSDATHEWLSTIFSDFGRVVYVSIPKYKPSGIIKGFAFVEFEEEASVDAALQYFQKIDCTIPSCMEPENLCSIVTYNQEAKNEKRPKKKSSGSESDSEPVAKRVKLDDAVQSDVIDTTIQGEPTEGNQKKKEKKSQKKKAMLKELGLQILAKKDWKKMRNRYLDMQRKSMKELKMHLNRQRFAQKYNVPKPQTEKVNNQVVKEDESIAEIKFIPNVIVKVALPEPCYTPKPMRKKIRESSTDIKYVEVPFGSTDAFLRFVDSEAAQAFCSSGVNENAVVLIGEEEKSYWNKIQESASLKKEKQEKPKKVRGRDKLLKKAEKRGVNHLRFGDETVE